jgi:hypothetical protein
VLIRKRSKLSTGNKLQTKHKESSKQVYPQWLLRAHTIESQINKT